MDTADNQKEGNDSPRYEFRESQLVIGYRIEMGHFLDWLPEKIHLVVQEGITEQEPIRCDNPIRLAKKLLPLMARKGIMLPQKSGTK